MDIDSGQIGQRVAFLRKKLELSQKELAQNTGINRSYITNVETGKQYPSFDFLHRLLKKYNISIDWLLTGNGQIELINENHLFSKLRDDHIQCLEKLLKLENKKQTRFMKAFNDLLEDD